MLRALALTVLQCENSSYISGELKSSFLIQNITKRQSYHLRTQTPPTKTNIRNVNTWKLTAAYWPLREMLPNFLQAVLTGIKLN